jgi:coenzyme F420 biosynthesis associated uncharacterized protein
LSDGRLVDWGLARRIAVRLAGTEREAGAFDQPALDAACADAVGLVTEYTRLEPQSPLPSPELIDRADWAWGGIRSLEELSGELERRMADGFSLPGPLGGLARSLAGAAVAAEAGAAVGYGARKVLGQYDVALAGADRPARLVFVGPNLLSAHQKLGEDPGLFLRWIAIHETTHSIQFSAVPWLRPHLSGLIGRLIGGASARLDPDSLKTAAGRLLRSDPRKTIRTVIGGELPRLLAGPEQRATMDALQAVMSIVEGHAEHVMDAAGEALEPGYARLRGRLDAHRADRSGLADVIAKLLGMELKMRQYRIGKAFCDEVASEGGIEALNEVWRSPEALPRLDELERPLDWMHRAIASTPA